MNALTCDICGGTKQVGYVKPKFKVCEYCDIDGCNYNGWDGQKPPRPVPPDARLIKIPEKYKLSKEEEDFLAELDKKYH